MGSTPPCQPGDGRAGGAGGGRGWGLLGGGGRGGGAGEILTTWGELTWGVGITGWMGVLVNTGVGGERRARALVEQGLGRIWA